MESSQVEALHIYKCAECGLVFETETFAEKCPRCRCRVLIHQKGEMRRAKGCNCGGSCAGCGGCSH
ncbi:MAG: hypothetical protein LUG14_08530 [Synergistaceae bacterium]|nr:hypothetical protein [Synergistaceae bacterium]MCD8164465.1 hypothetical protein [Synergistaceae bacterium]